MIRKEISIYRPLINVNYKYGQFYSCQFIISDRVLCHFRDGLICIAILSVRLIEKLHCDVTYKWDKILSMMLDG